MKQRSNTVLIPERGLSLEPEFEKEILVDTAFTRSIAHLAAQTGDRSIMIKATSDGRLWVASAGVPFEWMARHQGNAPNAWAVAQTYEYEEAILLTDFDIELFAVEIQFRNKAEVWMDERRLRVGISSIGFTHYGVRIRNRVPASVANFEIIVHR